MGELWGAFKVHLGINACCDNYGGIYGGVFTPTEAAAVAAVYAFFIAVFVYRDMGPLKDNSSGFLPGLLTLPKAIFHRDVVHVLRDWAKLPLC